MKNHNWTIFLFPLLYVTADFVTILKQNIGYNTAGKQPEVRDYSLALTFYTVQIQQSKPLKLLI